MGAAILVTVLSACVGGTTTRPVESATPSTTTLTLATGWNRANDFPLPGRDEPNLAWSGSEVFVVGGVLGPPCPPTADCVQDDIARDGAAFDPSTGTWRELADAPLNVPPWSAAFAGGRMFVYGERGRSSTGERELVLLSYDPNTNRWREYEAPDATPRMLVGDGDRLLLVSGSDERGVVPDLALDVATSEWSELPEDPIGPAFDRRITPTPAGLVLTAKALVADPGSGSPSATKVAIFDDDSGTWSRLPDIEQQIDGWQWVWSGTRLVSPELGGADGGKVGNWGREYPFGGVLTIPHGEWSPLPDVPEPVGSPWIRTASGGGRFMVGGGHVYDDKRETWTLAERPAGAAQAAGPAIWASERLVVVGGADWDSSRELKGTHSLQTWIYSPSRES